MSATANDMTKLNNIIIKEKFNCQSQVQTLIEELERVTDKKIKPLITADHTLGYKFEFSSHTGGGIVM